MRIAIITGGETGEREVSIKSARNIENIIDFAETEIFIFPEDKQKFISCVRNFDLAIPMIHGIGGEDGNLQTLFKILKIPFIFSDTNTNTIAIDKRSTKEIVKAIEVSSPIETSDFPLFAKPRTGGSSVASKLCRTENELKQLKVQNPDLEFITEQPIKGREFTVGVIEYQNKTFPLPIIEIIPKAEFFDYESKYDLEKLATEICPANINPELTRELQKQALSVHQLLNARHLSRSDFIVTNENEIFFLEINTIPGMTSTSLIPKMLVESKLLLKDLLEQWCTKL